MFEATRQGGVFLTMVYAGLLCGVLYDVLRVLRRITGAGRLWSAAADMAFWTAAAAVCALALMRVLRGPVRLYALLGACCGMCLYLLGVSELLYGAAQWGLHGAEWVKTRLFAHGKRKTDKNAGNEKF